MIGIAQDPPAEYPFIRDSYAARPMAAGRVARRAAPGPSRGHGPGRGVRRARARRRTRTPGTGVAPPTSGSL
jgi:hypothetical protein